MPVRNGTTDLKGWAGLVTTRLDSLLIGKTPAHGCAGRCRSSWLLAPAVQNLVEVHLSLSHHAQMKLVALCTFLGVAFMTSASVAAHHGISNAPETNLRPQKMSCTILAAWTSSGERVEPSIVNLTGPANLKDMGIGSPCGNNGSDCAPAINVTNGVPLQARVSGC